HVAWLQQQRGSTVKSENGPASQKCEIGRIWSHQKSETAVTSTGREASAIGAMRHGFGEASREQKAVGSSQKGARVFEALTASLPKTADLRSRGYAGCNDLFPSVPSCLRASVPSCLPLRMVH